MVQVPVAVRPLLTLTARAADTTCHGKLIDVVGRRHAGRFVGNAGHLCESLHGGRDFANSLALAEPGGRFILALLGP